jgi:hypothetical protein
VPLLARLFFGALFSGVAGTLWEWGWYMYNRSKIDYNDVLRAVIPCLIVIIWQYI